ncbi:hypothetical protein D9758_004105 [Tetrapyrgos nigripes]|uniref:Diphthamide biosynthesis protein 4 n=1 Tax=Tetrapyrgos nigripes TaxID=182062 RepID=A0A8H5GUH0_9AGAR|nr:hypothetical protein D9758_004105 [Tetrapyrgos nigripes]
MNSFTDFYQILSIPPSSSLSQIKSAYHRALLQHHPDKAKPKTSAELVNNNLTRQQSNSHSDPHNSDRSTSISISTIKQAYQTLFDASLRAEYDETRAKWLLLNASGIATSSSSSPSLGSGPRPAQIISLEDFTEIYYPEPDHDTSESESGWYHPCRCGGTYRITEAQMEQGQHLIGCESCSEVVWVGFEAVGEDEDKESRDVDGVEVEDETRRGNE